MCMGTGYKREVMCNGAQKGGVAGVRARNQSYVLTLPKVVKLNDTRIQAVYFSYTFTDWGRRAVPLIEIDYIRRYKLIQAYNNWS